MFEPRRQHPVASITEVLKSIRELLIPIIIVFIFGGGGSGNSFFFSPIFLSIFISYLLVSSILSWWRYTFYIDGDELRVEYGIIVRQKSFIPKHRIQVINISSGIIQRMFGLVSLNVQTAGGSTPGVTISALTREDAEELKSILSTETETTEGATVINEEDEEPLYALSWKNLIIAGSTSASFGIALSIIGTIFSQMQVLVDEDAVLDYAETFFKTDVNFIIALIFTLIFFAWLLSIVGNILAYANFTILKKKKEIVIKRGLLEKRTSSIPYSRIQAVRIQEGLLRQPFGFATIYVDSASFGEESGKSTVLFPLIKKKDAWEFIRTMVPEYDQQVESVRPPKRALRRYIIRSLIPIIILIVALYYLIPYGILSIALIPVGVYLGYLRFKAAKIGVNDDTVIVRYRVLAKTTAIVRKYRIQAFTGWDNWFQRRKKLKSLSISVASSNTGADFLAKDFEENYILNLIDWGSPQFSKPKKQHQQSDEIEPDITDWLDAGI